MAVKERSLMEIIAQEKDKVTADHREKKKTAIGIISPKEARAKRDEEQIKRNEELRKQYDLEHTELVKRKKADEEKYKDQYGNVKGQILRRLAKMGAQTGTN